MLFTPLKASSLQLSNRVVMSPLTRSRASQDNIPTALMAEYYGQRATAGLIITEGTSPSPNGLGYPRMPGLFNAVQVAGWKQVTDAVHAKGGKIVIQLMHTGRVTHVANLPAGAEVVGPSADPCPGEMITDAQGMQPHSTPWAMTQADITTAVDEYVQSAKLAIEAGFDGVELHAANGYLIEQFLNANVNKRTDGYGSSIEGRNRFALEVARATAAAIGADKVGIRLSPHGVLGGTGTFPEVDAQYLALTDALSSLELAYIHVLDHSALGTPPVPEATKKALRAAFKGTFILAGGFDRASAEAALAEGRADLIAFGRPFIANPDWVARMRNGAAVSALDMSTFYTPGPKGYTDYPSLGA
ncbi:NADH:flavin oxidoreductase/NADH oxidase [Rhodoferax ferrireducens T118]|uniref:NADH:flavin oxidoreductase/NADH oxidase n=1 Tax=Albidiferax ferrireducens (strain ATCC BAA-621 / DSM 15236 / T118) TaxID=338969 RepID=Q222J2_ALBFT|nr:alkene reductase [Rhodoferax ferrireducens]ABD68061.1 NADH:flavin oxidoreductase/NADH oxidase [Rhodoferax ferrireducens T118]